MVFASTGGAIYGDFVTPPNVETFPKDPESPYAITKMAAELYLAYYGRVHGLESVALRFGNVYGPRQDPHGEAGVVAIFCGRLLAGHPLTIFGDGKQTRDYVFVGDVADATWRATTRPIPPVGQLDARAFNVGTGIATSVLRLAEVLRKAAGVDVAIEHAPKRPGEQQVSFLNVEKAAKLLDWKPTVSLEEGLRRSFAWFAERESAGTAAGSTGRA
jgi:UDP-glucose 4-epimerase